MKLLPLVPWVLAGGLCASTAWNLHLVGRVDALETELAPARTSAAPARVRVEPVFDQGGPRELRALGLSREQNERLRGFSMT